MSGRIVADTSVFLAVALAEPERDWIVEVTADCTVLAPEVLPFEIGNALSAMVRRNRLTGDEALGVLECVRQIPVHLVPVDIDKALSLATEFNIYAYDAYFLQSAWRFSCPLLTLDKGMRRIADHLGVRMIRR
ncbi:type II toxin-antitoxin system VapC family toxin [Methylomarinovum tepidoasis]|uniref:type II toxin-antitoxin system VapC family toxin n=1 Tax=Methylomarinovum tepidoasis TaxID=2840183 RepID=UPI002572A573|nr:type II toxin-antitoxin system VapC family toxin [Methylomarinovum sp. IN45]